MKAGQADNASKKVRIAFFDQIDVVVQVGDLRLTLGVASLVGGDYILFVRCAEKVGYRKLGGRDLHSGRSCCASRP